MVREEYEGQSSEMYDPHYDEQVIFYTHFCTTSNEAYQPSNNSTKPNCLIDEDSVPLAAESTITQEAGLFLCRSSSIRYTAPYVPHLDFYSLCKLQI
jgi:hypothetical protein